MKKWFCMRILKLILLSYLHIMLILLYILMSSFGYNISEAALEELLDFEGSIGSSKTLLIIY